MAKKTKFLQRRPIQKIIAYLIGIYIRLFGITSRWHYKGREHPQAFWDQKQPVILAVWHGRLAAVPYLTPNTKQLAALTSNHKDGRIIGDTLQSFGGIAAKGSSTQGGSSGFRHLLRLGKQGYSLLITPDAPPQKVYTCAKGVAELARLSGLPIIPCAISTTKGKQLKTKDRFMLPRLFSTFHVFYGAPLTIDRKATEKERAHFLADIENTLQKLTQQADNQTEHPDWS